MLRDLVLALVVLAAAWSSRDDGLVLLIPGRWVTRALPTLEDECEEAWVRQLQSFADAPVAPSPPLVTLNQPLAAGTGLPDVTSPAPGQEPTSPGREADDEPPTVVRGMRAIIDADLGPYLDSLPGYGGDAR